jgi:hypothetical protein
VTLFTAISVWLLLSSLIRQVDNVIGGQAPETGLNGPEGYEPAVQIIKIAIAAFSVLLLGLSISAYKKTALRNIIYAAVAFGLFAAQLFFDYLNDAVAGFEQPYSDVIFYAMTLAILLLFFLAIVRRASQRTRPATSGPNPT